MLRPSVGLLAEHIACAGYRIYGQAIKAEGATALFLTLDAGGTDYVAFPIGGDGDEAEAI